MENKDFARKATWLWMALIGSSLLVFIGAYAKIQHWPLANKVLFAGLVFSFAAWVVIVADMWSSKIYNKAFWLISMFVFPTIAAIVYLARRNSLLQQNN